MINNVVFGFLGSRLDLGGSEDRWQAWRPTVSLGMHEEFLMRRLEIFHGPNETRLLQTVLEDLGAVSPETEIRTHAMPLFDGIRVMRLASVGLPRASRRYTVSIDRRFETR